MNLIIRAVNGRFAAGIIGIPEQFLLKETDKAKK